MQIYFTGIIIAISTFLMIGVFHPLVLKVESYKGTRYWWVLLVLGILSVGAALLVENTMVSALIGVFGASSLWTIGELFSQKKRVQKGWFPMNPKRKDEYEPIDPNETLCPVHHGRSIYAIDEKDQEDKENQKA